MTNLTDFERGILYGWMGQAEMPTEVRNIIKKIVGIQEQYESVYEGNNLAEFMAKARLSPRTISILTKVGHKSLDDLMSLSDAYLLKEPNFGRKSLEELKHAFKRFGLVGRRAALLEAKKD